MSTRAIHRDSKLPEIFQADAADNQAFFTETLPGRKEPIGAPGGALITARTSWQRYPSNRRARSWAPQLSSTVRLTLRRYSLICRIFHWT